MIFLTSTKFEFSCFGLLPFSNVLMFVVGGGGGGGRRRILLKSDIQWDCLFRSKPPAPSLTRLGVTLIGLLSV